MSNTSSSNTMKKCVTCEYFKGERVVASSGRVVQHLLNGNGVCLAQKNKAASMNGTCARFQKWSKLK